MAEPSTKKRKANNGSVGDNAPSLDSRFANIRSDPRYRLPNKKQKVTLDSRFARSFKNEDFTKRAKVDRYGRSIENDAESRRLKQKFSFEEDEDDSDELDDDDEVVKDLKRVGRKHDVLREGKDVSSSEDESSTDDDDSDLEEKLQEQTAQSKEEVPLGEVSSRIAVVNLDWDNIRADDLMAVFSSFLPAGGRMLNVTVYPSEFGKERMEREELEGPPKEIFAASTGADNGIEEHDTEDENVQDDDEMIKDSIIKPDDGSEFDSAALRQYQMERLRYYFAVLTFSSPDVAKTIYDSCDGAEYLSTANFFDLRFVPEDMDFTTDVPRDECSRLPSGYRPNEFVTDALQHSKVKLTWDQEDRSRKEAQARAFRGGQKEIDENDLRAYLGSDSEESEGGPDEALDAVDGSKVLEDGISKKEAERQKARALLGLAPEPKKRSKKDRDAPIGNVHVTFASGLSASKDPDKKQSVFENSPEPEETTVEKYVRKEKERKQKRKEKMKASRQDEGTENVEKDDVGEDGPVAEPDLGFDDPFFNEAKSADGKNSTKLQKMDRLKKRQLKEEKEMASAAERKQLELLMSDEDDLNTTGTANKSVRHFSMAEIERAEKLARKGSKAAKKLLKKSKMSKQKDQSALAAVAKDDFEMKEAVADPRFGKLFESHEFAIDPSRPGLRKTEGTKTLLEESRRRRRKNEASGKTIEQDTVKGSRDGEVRELVAKIKRKSR